MNPFDLNELNRRFAVTQAIQFVAGPAGLPHLQLNGPWGKARLCVQGAQLLHWQPRGARQVLWLSPRAQFAAGQAIRGGIPICWPWFGAHPNQPAAARHGYARTALWQVVSCQQDMLGGIQVNLKLPADAAPAGDWPQPIWAELNIQISNAGLVLSLWTHNLGDAPVQISQALHTYFAVSDVQQVSVQGLAGLSYVDKLAEGGQLCTQTDELSIDGAVDRVYLDTPAECRLIDPRWQRCIHIQKRGSASTVVWNPGAEQAEQLSDMGNAANYLRMLCIESANVGPNAFELAPGASHELWTAYRVEPLPESDPSP